MEIQQGIKKAIEGGYNEEQRLTPLGIIKPIHEILLDTKFWKALSKAEGWLVDMHGEGVWLDNWHLFIQNLAQDQSLEEAFNKATQKYV